jgi:hypothetical protein
MPEEELASGAVVASAVDAAAVAVASAVNAKIG